MLHSRWHTLPSTVAALALTFLVAGCGSDDADPGRAQEPPPRSAGTPTTPAEPTNASPTKSTSRSPAPEESTPPTPGEATTAAPATTRGGRLLPAAQVPGFNPEFAWKVESTRAREGRRPFGTCHKFAMTSIGATRVRARSYVPARTSAGSTASHLVADFPDEKTAKRAYEVLRSWRGQCDEELAEYDRHEVGRLQPVELPSGVSTGDGEASWYLLGYGPPKGEPASGYFDAQGLTRVGQTISVLQMRLIGQDYNYGAGQEPMVAALRTSAARLTGSPPAG